MALTGKMVASEVLMCGVKFGLRQIPIVGEVAVNVVDGLLKRHEMMSNAAQLAEFEAQLSRVERGMRDTVQNEIRTILCNLGKPGVPGPELTREMTELRQIYEQGWVPNLFEGLLRNSSHWQDMKRDHRPYGRILGDHEPVDPENGMMHLLLDKEKTRILELPAASLALLLSNQTAGIPVAEMRASQDIWAFPAPESHMPKDADPGELSSKKNTMTREELFNFIRGEWSALSRVQEIQRLSFVDSHQASITYRKDHGEAKLLLMNFECFASSVQLHCRAYAKTVLEISISIIDKETIYLQPMCFGLNTSAFTRLDKKSGVRMQWDPQRLKRA